MKNISKLLLIFLFITSSAYATLDLELTQGVNKAIPIAINGFNKNNIIGVVIKSDLTNSGRFNLTDTNDADYIVKGSGQKFTLLDVYGKTVLLNKKYHVVPNKLRALAHHISDLIYQQVTGQRGIFSTKIAYVLVKNNHSYNLMVADADGFNAQCLVTTNAPLMSPAWSPDGKKIAYVSFENHHATIYIHDITTGKRKAISSYPGINGAPAWSPDSKKLALVLTKTGYPKIYILDLATKKLQQITTGWSLDTEPGWSPDGKTLLFTSSRGGNPQIFVKNLLSGQITRLTYTDNYNARASFTPNGKNIIMLTRSNGRFAIATQNLANNRVTILTDYGSNDKSPSVAPNGNMIVYSTTYANRGILAEVSLDGTVHLRVPSPQGDVEEPAWSPFFNNREKF